MKQKLKQLLKAIDPHPVVMNSSTINLSNRVFQQFQGGVGGEHVGDLTASPARRPYPTQPVAPMVPPPRICYTGAP